MSKRTEELKIGEIIEQGNGRRWVVVNVAKAPTPQIKVHNALIIRLKKNSDEPMSLSVDSNMSYLPYGVTLESRGFKATGDQLYNVKEEVNKRFSR